MAMFRDDRPGMRALLDALQAPATPEELAGEERARALFTTFLPEPATPRRRRLLPVSLAAAAVVALSTGAVSAIAFVPSAPQRVPPESVTEQWQPDPTGAATPGLSRMPLPSPVAATPRPVASATANTGPTRPVPTRALAGAPVTTAPTSVPDPGAARPSTGQATPAGTSGAAVPSPPADPRDSLCRAYQRGKITQPRLERLTGYAGGQGQIDAFCAALLGGTTPKK